MLTHPLFLIGLLAVGIPIAIHLLQVRRYRKVYFSNVDMLEGLQSQEYRQRNIRQWLILAARILTIIFLVLAFCQPVIRNRHSQMSVGGTAVSVYIDNSYSMECGGMRGSLLEAARQKAREIAEAYKPDDRFQLLTNDFGGGMFHWLSREEFLTALDAVQTTAATQKLSSVAMRQNGFLRLATATNRHAYIVSDFQRTTSDLAQCPVDSTILTTFVPLEGSEVSNIYIDSLAFNSPAYYPGAVVKVEVVVRNDGDKPIQSLPLRLFVDGKQRALTSVDLVARGEVSAVLTFTLGNESMLQGFVETTDYPITFDDRMYFTLPVTQQIPMLVVSGQEENPYIRRLFQGDTLVGYHQVSVSQIDYAHLFDHRLIVLDELHAIPMGLSQLLHKFVADGGSLLVIPGQGVESASYNQLLSLLQSPRLGEWMARGSHADRLEFDMGLFLGVFQDRQSDMELPMVAAHYRLSTDAHTVAQTAIKLLDGDALLSVTTMGDGYCYLFSTPLRPEYTDFVQQALFVPTLYNMALYSTPLRAPYHFLTGIDPIPLLGSYDAENLPHLIPSIADIKGNGVDIIPDFRRIGACQYMLTHDAIARAGNYRLSYPGTGVDVSDAVSLEGFSFNYSRAESNLTFFTSSEVQKLVDNLPLKQCTVAPSVQKSMTEYIRQRSHGQPLWRICLVMALLALLLETLLIKIPLKSSHHPRYQQKSR